jgi:hypothetical protein
VRAVTSNRPAKAPCTWTSSARRTDPIGTDGQRPRLTPLVPLPPGRLRVRDVSSAEAVPQRASRGGKQRSPKAPAKRSNQGGWQLFSQVRGHTQCQVPGDSQAYSAGSIPVIRSSKKAQVSDLGLLRCLDLSSLAVPSACPKSAGCPAQMTIRVRAEARDSPGHSPQSRGQRHSCGCGPAHHHRKVRPCTGPPTAGRRAPPKPPNASPPTSPLASV